MDRADVAAAYGDDNVGGAHRYLAERVVFARRGGDLGERPALWTQMNSTCGKVIVVRPSARP